jgi:uncharacterized protein (DUF952 family)
VALDDLDLHALYHLATEAEWADHRDAGSIAPPSLEDEGFVHCSWGHQVPGTVTKHFAHVTGLLALRLDRSALGDVRFVEEDSYGSGQAFPHVYGPIPLAAVIGTTPVT